MDNKNEYVPHHSDEETEKIIREFTASQYFNPYTGRENSGENERKNEYARAGRGSDDSQDFFSSFSINSQRTSESRRPTRITVDGPRAGSRRASGRNAVRDDSIAASRNSSSAGTGSRSRRSGNSADKPKHKILRVVRRTATSIFLPILCLCIVLFSADALICYGPSDSVRGLFVTTVMETSAAKFLAQIFLSDEKIAAIRAANAAVESDDVTNPNLVVIDNNKTDSTAKDIEVFDVTGGTFKGKMMIVQDPSRLKVATLSYFGEGVRGKKVTEFIKENNAVAGINAGGFVDTNGNGSGGLPMGIVITDGKLRFGSKSNTYSVVGFDNDNKLVVGRMSASKALSLGVRDAVSFGPSLIINGERAEITGNGSGLNPRTCIGQRADGAVLILVIDGRRPDSIGASLEDCIDVMEEYKAVNAGNLDGGSSTVLYLNGSIINNCASVYGPRRMCTAFVVV